MGSWQFGYDQLNRLTTAANPAWATGPQVPAAGWAPNFCWAYDAFGNRLQQATSSLPFTTGNGSCSTTGTLYQNVWASYSSQTRSLRPTPTDRC